MSLVIDRTCQMMIPDIDLLISSIKDITVERHIVERQHQNILIYRLPIGEEHSRKTETEYTNIQVISWRET